MTKVLGTQTSGPITAEQLDVVAVSLAVTVVSYSTPELNALCPVTGQPDQYDLLITYEPQGLSVESKSLKLYLWSFRDRGFFAEDLAATIAQDLTDVLGRTVAATVEQRVRGGLTLSATAAGTRRSES